MSVNRAVRQETDVIDEKRAVAFSIASWEDLELDDVIEGELWKLVRIAAAEILEVVWH